MKILEINSVCEIGSTGRIAVEIAQKYIKEGNQVIIAYGRNSTVKNSQSFSKKICSELDVRINALKARIFDSDGFCAKKITKKFIKWADSYNPDILWLHNLHGYYINVELLFDWIKKKQDLKVFWTLHDCWAFTGHCSYFTYCGCDKWKVQCNNCPQKTEYPASFFFDKSKRNYKRKKRAFCGVSNLTVITPSYWLANLIKNSFLKEYPIDVHHNTINKNVFKPTKSDIKEKLGISDKKIILGVAAQWQKRKGFADFLLLSNLLNSNCVIILVGVTKKQKRFLPKNIIGIEKTNNVEELVQLYSASDVFFNPTYEDNYPTVNLEAIACGIPVVTYNTGGSPESIDPNFVVEPGNLNKAVELFYKIFDSDSTS